MFGRADARLKERGSIDFYSICGAGEARHGGFTMKDKKGLEELLRQVAEGTTSIEEAALQLREVPFEDLGFAKTDLHRGMRQGIAEVIYGAGKTPEQILKIAQNLYAHDQGTILITRMAPEAAALIGESNMAFSYDSISRVGIIGSRPEPDGKGTVVIATGGTSDIPVAEEAALTAEIFGNKVARIYDVGVAGIHRLLAHQREIQSARVIVAIAGMEGALASVIGGLTSCPVIAVPTSVGYGASFGGLSALLSMLNSCASGVSVVNIDNGFGAGYLASMINHLD